MAARFEKEEDRTPVGRSDFKSVEARTTCLVGSTPTLFRQYFAGSQTLTNSVGSSSLPLRAEPIPNPVNTKLTR